MRGLRQTFASVGGSAMKRDLRKDGIPPRTAGPILLALAGLIVLLSCPKATAGLIWQSELVDSLADQSDVALAVDGDGGSHIVYRRANRAWYAHKQAGGNWTIERIPYSAFTEVVVVDVALVTDVAGMPRVAFASNDQSDEIQGPGALVYATKLDGSWTITRVEDCSAYGYDTGGMAV